MNDIFIQASRQKYRYNTVNGSISTEDLWDLPLSDTSKRANLDDIAKELNRQLKAAGSEQSFVKPVVAATNDLQVQFDIVLHVIKVKMEERDARKVLADKAAKKQRILELISIKEDAELSSKSLEELKAEVNSI